MSQDKVELYWGLLELLTPEEKIRMARKLIDSVPDDFEVEPSFEEKLKELEEEAEAQKAAYKAKRAKKLKDIKEGANEEEDETAIEVITDERKIKDFSGIDAAGCVDVHVTQGSKFRVAVIGRRKDVKHIKTSLRKDVLHVTVDPMCSFGNSTILSGNNIVSIGHGVTVVNGRVIGGGGSIILDPIHVEVTMPKLNSLSTSGSGDIEVEDDFVSEEDAVLTVSGSGDISLPKLDCNGFGAAVKGSGNIHVRQLNTKDDVFIAIKGSGDVEITSAYIAGDSDLQIQGSGDFRINGSTNNVSAHVLGSGDISGNLKYNNISSSCMGTGDIRFAGYRRKKNRFDW